MKHVVIILAVGMVLVATAVAEDGNLCEDMATYSCAMGTYSDGTGTIVKRIPSARSSKVNGLIFAESKALEERFGVYLQDPENAYFKRLAIASLGLNDAPECRSSEIADQKKCSNNAAQGLAEIAKVKLDYPEAEKDKKKSYGSELDLSKMSYILKHEGFKQILNESSERLSAGEMDPEKLKKVKEVIFPKVKSLLIKKISDLPIDEEKKKLMIEKVKGVHFGGSNCSALRTGVSEAYLPNAFYHPMEQQYMICKGLLGGDSSEFNIARVIGHELAHSIDPCGLSYGPAGVALVYSTKQGPQKMDSEYPIQGLISCLRSEKSVQAVRIKDPKAKKNEPPDFCENDQITESIADWFGDEVMVDYISANHPNLSTEQWQDGVANAFRPTCRTPTSEVSEHPETVQRINTILLVNPKVRQKMGCLKPHSTSVYCDATNPDAMAQAIAAPKAKGRGGSGRSSSPDSKSTDGVK